MLPSYIIPPPLLKFLSCNNFPNENVNRYLIFRYYTRIVFVKMLKIYN